MLEDSTQEASVTSQADDHCENEEAPKVSSANPIPSSGKTSLQVLMIVISIFHEIWLFGHKLINALMH